MVSLYTIQHCYNVCELLGIENITVIQSYVTSTVLSWSILPVTYYQYEVAYSSNCSSSTLPAQGYTAYDNITSDGGTITGLQPDTCYIFGVRAISTITNQPGEWTVIVNNTRALSESSCDYYIIDYIMCIL